MFEKIDHMNLTVASLAESVDWYARVFGFEKLESGFGMNGNPYVIVGRNDFAICMYEHTNLRSAAEAPDSDFHQIYHFGIRVVDVEAWRTVVREQKLKLYYGGGEVSYPRSTSWYIQDPSGHEIEVSYTPKGLWGSN